MYLSTCKLCLIRERMSCQIHLLFDRSLFPSPYLTVSPSCVQLLLELLWGLCYCITEGPDHG